MVISMVEEEKKKEEKKDFWSHRNFWLDICKFSGEFKDSVTHFKSC